MNPETSSTPEGAITDRIWNAVPVSQQAFFKLLSLLEIEITPQVPTACVTLGTRSKLRINPDFVARHCQTDQRLVMLVLHELFHVLLGHTRLYERVTPVQNWAFDAVINSHLCLLFPDSAHTSLFRRLYKPDVFPEALLRPPEDWNTPWVRWHLQGEALQAHKALYTESSATYEELFALIQNQLGQLQSGHPVADPGGVEPSMERLLGNHDEQNPQGVDPDFAREVQDIVARWPMHERHAGPDKGADLDRTLIDVGDARIRTVAVIRRALWPLLDSGAACSGAPRLMQGTVESCLPYRTMMDRKSEVVAACGLDPVFFKAVGNAPEIRRFEKVHVYVDVSGSMNDVIPVLYGALLPLMQWLHPRVHAFSTGIRDLSFSQIRKGAVESTWGTDIDCVTGHLLEHRIRRALILTDGWVGKVPSEHARRLKKRRVRVNSVITEYGDTSFASAFSGRVYPLRGVQALP